MTSQPKTLPASLILLLWCSASCSPASNPQKTVENPTSVSSKPLEKECAPPDKISPDEAVQTYYAKFEAPCGMSILALSKTPEGPFDTGVVVRGENSPIRKLRYQVLAKDNTFVVQGRITDKYKGGYTCDKYPVFQIESFDTHGPINRCPAIGAAQPQVHTTHLPTDKLVPEDFEDGPSLPLIDDDQCELLGDKSACTTPSTHLVKSCWGDVFCCKLIPQSSH